MAGSAQRSRLSRHGLAPAAGNVVVTKPSQLLVEDSVPDEVVAPVVEAVAASRPIAEVMPMIIEAQFDKPSGD